MDTLFLDLLAKMLQKTFSQMVGLASDLPWYTPQEITNTKQIQAL